MRIKALLGLVIFSLGIFYLTLLNYGHPHQLSKSNPYGMLYGITGSDAVATDLLKCLDKKSIIYAAQYEKSPVDAGTILTKECLEDWLVQEAEKMSQGCQSN